MKPAAKKIPAKPPVIDTDAKPANTDTAKPALRPTGTALIRDRRAYSSFDRFVGAVVAGTHGIAGSATKSSAVMCCQPSTPSS